METLVEVANGKDSPQGNFAHVDLDQKGLGHELIIPFVGVDTAFGWKDDPVYVPVLRGIVEAGRSAEDVYRVVMAPYQAVRPKA